MAGANGQGRGRLFLPGGRMSGPQPGDEIHPADLHEVMSFEEWLRKPASAASRGEVAAYCNSIVQNQVRAVCQMVVDRRSKELAAYTDAAVAAAIFNLMERRWHRRLYRWVGRLLGVGDVGTRTESVSSASAPDVPAPEPTPTSDQEAPAPASEAEPAK